jgi:hypothetical protein
MSAIGASGTLYIQQSGSDIQYSPDNSSWTTISSWPVTVSNTVLNINNILNVLFTTDISTNNAGFRFITGTSYITFDGSYNSAICTLNINAGIAKGMFSSTYITAGDGGGGTSGNHTVKVKNFIIRGTGTMFSFCYNFGSYINNISGFNPSINYCSLENCVNYKSMSDSMTSSLSAWTGTILVSGCINNASVPIGTGGIAGSSICVDNGIATIENCINNGVINGGNAGGIVGGSAGNQGGTLVIQKCINTGTINTGAGIVGDSFAANTSNLCSITNCYSTGNIGNNGFGICSNNVGINSGSYNPIVNITNCYSLGTISGINNAGIIGKNGSAVTNAPTVNISNCYSYGTYSNNNGINSPGSLYPYNITNCYAANGSWSDTSANTSLTGYPITFYSNNPGTTWAKVVNNTSSPYVLSAFNSAVYDPSMVEQQVASNYTSAPGLFQSDYSYNLLFVNDSAPSNVSINGNNGELTFTDVPFGVSNSETASVFVTQGTAPYYKNYNLNTFAYSNVCFPAKTPIQTDQGLINIEDLNPEIHTIRNKKIVGITQTITGDKHLVCFEKDCFGKNVPCQKTFISQNHSIFYKGKMMKAKKFVGLVDNVYMKKYTGEVLYNVLMKEHDKMLVNNLICETLHPENSIAKLYLFLKGMTPEMQQKYIKEYNEEAIEKKIYTSKK